MNQEQTILAVMASLAAMPDPVAVAFHAAARDKTLWGDMIRAAIENEFEHRYHQSPEYLENI